MPFSAPSLQKCFGSTAFCACWLRHVLCAAAPCMSQPLKFRECSELTVLFRFHYCFTSQSAPIMKCFWHFDLEIFFVPHRPALFFSHLLRWLRACRFSEPIVRPSRQSRGAGKAEVSRLSYCFPKPASSASSFFFLLQTFRVNTSLWQAMSRFCSKARCRVSDVASTTKSCPAGGGSWEHQRHTGATLATFVVLPCAWPSHTLPTQC